MLAEPTAKPFTEPVDDTLAMLGDSDVQETASPVIGAPDASRAVALACETFPTVREDESIATTTDATTGGGGGVEVDAFTTIEDVPSAAPTAAFTTAVPAPIAVTAPEDETVATFGASDVHVTLWPDSKLPAESFTTADAVAT